MGEGDGQVNLDDVLATMRETGLAMKTSLLLSFPLPFLLPSSLLSVPLILPLPPPSLSFAFLSLYSEIFLTILL